jgi:hypothetical protein
VEGKARRGFQIFGMGRESTRGDRVIYGVNYIWMFFWFAVVTVVWFTVGGIRDYRDLLRRLKTRRRDDNDDGFARRRIEESRGVGGLPAICGS